MTSTESILQCGMCHRQHDGAGEVLPFQYSFKVPQIVACGRADCGDVVATMLEKELARRADRAARLKNHTPAARRSARDERHESKQECRRAAAAANVNVNVRLPYADDSNEEAERRPRNGMQNEECEAVPEAHDGGQAGPSLTQNEFVASGKADSANDRLLEFFEHLIASGQVGRWQSRKLLKEICKNDYINNRIDNLRPHFAEKGLKIVNGEVSPAEGLPKSSHYRLLLMSDGEFGEFQRSGKVPLS